MFSHCPMNREAIDALGPARHCATASASIHVSIERIA
jgi:hypothetical protein